MNESQKKEGSGEQRNGEELSREGIRFALLRLDGLQEESNQAWTDCSCIWKTVSWGNLESTL